jgi:hypothetical protein
MQKYGQNLDLSAFERGMVVGARTATLLDFFTLNSLPCVSRMVHHPKDIQTT